MYNAVGEGPSSAPQEVFVGEAGRVNLPLITIHVVFDKQNTFLLNLFSLLVPTAPPQNVVVQSSTATQLDITWDPPPLDTQNGDIQGYKVSLFNTLSLSILSIYFEPYWKTMWLRCPQIYFWEFQLQNETERLRTLFLPELGVKLKNLTGYTTYMISVAAFNAAGDGPRSLPTRGRTQQAGANVDKIIQKTTGMYCGAKAFFQYCVPLCNLILFHSNANFALILALLNIPFLYSDSA